MSLTTKTILLIILATFASLLKAYVILDVSKLFHLDFITQFNLLQIYIIISIIAVVRYKPESDKELSEVVSEGYKQIFGLYLSSLILWGTSYLINLFA